MTAPKQTGPARRPLPDCPECGRTLTDRPYGGAGPPYDLSCTPCANRNDNPPLVIRGDQIAEYVEQARRDGYKSPHERLPAIPKDRWPDCPRCGNKMEPAAGTARIWWKCPR